MAKKSAEPILIRIDAELVDLVRAYVANRKRDVHAIRAALDRRDFDAIARIGHNLHGSGRTFGFEVLTAIGSGLQRAAAAGEEGAVARLRSELCNFISRIEVKTVDPLSAQHARSAIELVPTGSAGDGAVSKGCYVLVVDDQEMNRLILSRYLERDGYTVRQAASGDEALALLERSPLPMLVLLDVVMVGLNGLEVCRRIKKNPRTRDVPVVLITGSERAEDRTGGIEAGADAFMTKPVERHTVLALVRQFAPAASPEAPLCERRSPGL